MNLITRNLFNTLKHFKLASIFNIVGLSIAFAAFTVIMIQINHERNFDKVHPTSERVFRVTFPDTDNTFAFILSRPFIEEVMHSSPHIEAATLINPYIGNIYFSIADRDEKRGFRHDIVTCSPGITHVFDFPIIDGDKDCLHKPESVIIPQSLAKTLFGDESAIGKSILSEEDFWSKDRKDFVIGAVYKDFPNNTQLDNSIYTAMTADYGIDQWYSSNYLCYLLLDNKDEAQNVIDNFNLNFDFTKLVPEGLNDMGHEKITLTPLTDIYFLNEARDGNIIKSGNKETANILITIAILIIGIASVNFMNFSSSLAPLRIKKINTHKILGCSDTTLRLSLLSEAVAISFFSFLLCILYIYIFDNTNALPFIEADLTLYGNRELIAICGGFALLVGLLSGIYPALYMTSFSPIIALAGNFGLSPSGKRIRTALIGFQFVISIGLIIAVSFIWLQNNYMQNFSLGFDKDRIVIAELNAEFYKNHRAEYAEQLTTFAGIEDVAFGMDKLGSQDHYGATRVVYKEQEFGFLTLYVSWNFFKVMGIPVIAGRYPRATDVSESNNLLYFNESAYKKYDMEVDDIIDFWGKKYTLQGVLNDTKFTSLRQTYDNQGFIISSNYNDRMPLSVSYIRLKAGSNHSAAIDHIRSTITNIDPSFPVKIEFYDTLFDRLYHKEQVLRQIFTVLSILAILISIVGVFGMVIFETEYRRKEIGIRKVLGATIGEILIMFNKIYIHIILVCFLIAIPIVYYGITQWLNGFVYKIPIYWWVFLTGMIGVLAITILIVSIQCWRIATANPSESIKNE